MCAIFRMCGSESQPGLELVEKLAMPLKTSRVDFPKNRKLHFLGSNPSNKTAGNDRTSIMTDKLK